MADCQSIENKIQTERCLNDKDTEYLFEVFKTFDKDSVLMRKIFFKNFPNNVFYGLYAFMYEIVKKSNLLCDCSIKLFFDDIYKTVLSNNEMILLNFENKSYFHNVKQLKEDMLCEYSLWFSDSRILFSETYQSRCERYYDNVKRIKTLGLSWYINKLATGNTVKILNKTFSNLCNSDEFLNLYLQYMHMDKLERNSTVIDAKWLENEMNPQQNDDMLMNINLGFKEADNTIGSFARGNILSIIAPPKCGKTRFCVYLAQRCLANGYNVLYLSTQSTKESITSCFISAITCNEDESGISSFIVSSNKTNEEEKKLIKTAKQKLATGKDRGQLYITDMVSTLPEVIAGIHACEIHGFVADVIVLDCIADLIPKHNEKKTELIEKAYMQLKEYNDSLLQKCLIITTGYMKQEYIDTMLRDNDGKMTVDVTAAADSASIIRYPDYVFALFATTEEKMFNKMRLYNVASRHSECFEDFDIKANLACCKFEDTEDSPDDYC